MRSPAWRAVSVAIALAAFLVLAFVLPIPAHAFTMGDGSSIVQDRSNFDDLVHSHRTIRFSAHLSYRVLDQLDAWLGSTAETPTEVYRILSWLAGVLVALSLLSLAATDQWSPRAVRYIALSLFAPATLMYFGYLEVGYLSLSRRFSVHRARSGEVPRPERRPARGRPPSAPSRSAPR